jgi:hypothetical protein
MQKGRQDGPRRGREGTGGGAEQAARNRSIHWSTWSLFRTRRPATGAAGSLLFGISRRAYGNDAAKAFLTSLRDFKAGQISALSKMPMPRL